MKQIILILFLSGFVFAKPIYWVQVIAVKHPSSLTKNFLKKIKSSKKGYKIVNRHGYKKVLVGSFKTFKQARIANIFFKHYIAKDTFVVKTNQFKISPKKVRLISKIKMTTSKLLPKKSVVIALKKTTMIKKLDLVSPIVKSCISLCKKQRVKQSEIASAVAFYKHSKFYKFSDGHVNFIY